MRYFWRIRRDLFQSGTKKGGVWLECSEDAPVHTLPENAEGKAGLAELHLRLQSAPPSLALPSPALPNLHKLELERLTERERERERESSTQGGAGQGSLSCLYSPANCFSSQIKLQCPPYIGGAGWQSTVEIEQHDDFIVCGELSLSAWFLSDTTMCGSCDSLWCDRTWDCHSALFWLVLLRWPLTVHQWRTCEHLKFR